jgi:hypothetical protein
VLAGRARAGVRLAEPSLPVPGGRRGAWRSGCSPAGVSASQRRVQDVVSECPAPEVVSECSSDANSSCCLGLLFQDVLCVYNVWFCALVFGLTSRIYRHVALCLLHAYIIYHARERARW